MSDLIVTTTSTDHPALERLAHSVDSVARPQTRLRPDGLVEVRFAGAVVGWIDYQAPVYVALAGDRLDRAVEIAQTHTVPAAIDALVAAA
jgi:hypothetical protein